MTTQIINNTIIESPPDWSQFFGNDNPLELEIGTGRTHYLFERAAAEPNRNHVGIEWKGTHTRQGQQKISREGIKNVCLIHGNAWLLAPAFFAPTSVQTIALHFPDPWWKKKHEKKRIINPVFTDILARLLKKDGELYFQSDVRMIFDMYTEALEAHPHLNNTSGPGGELDKNPMGARSHREKKCEDFDQPVYRSLFTKS